MRFDAFVDALYRAGWKSPNDAQHTEIKKLWADIFPSTADAENDIEDLCSEIRRLNLQVHELKLNKQPGGEGVSVKRYKQGYCDVYECESGELMMFEEHEAQLAALKEENERLKNSESINEGLLYQQNKRLLARVAELEGKDR